MSNPESIIHQILPFFVFAVLAVFLFRIFKHKSLKGALFGADILETVGSLELSRKGSGNSTLSVHKLKARDADDFKVGIELTRRNMGAGSIIPITLSMDEARELSRLLRSVTGQ